MIVGLLESLSLYISYIVQETYETRFQSSLAVIFSQWSCKLQGQWMAES
jgi:hypothetical protein